MQIIIPMSGVGQRFADAGYHTIKPLIKVNGKTIIEYVIDFFTPEDDFIFIVNETHLTNTNLQEVLLAKVPNATIVPIAPHKLGPVYAVQQAYKFISDTKPCIVNYCDFNMLWDYTDFLKTVQKDAVDGAIPCYKGFHPHLAHPHNVYAGCLVNEENRLLAIKEKFSYSVNKFDSHHSVGTYYFKSGSLLKKYSDDLIAKKHTLQNEYYASMVYEQMLYDDLHIVVYDKLTHFCQWGTPTDLQEFNWWMEVFAKEKSFLHTVQKQPIQQGNLLMPMAGNGQRFVEDGYTTTKPLIVVAGMQMYKKALSYLIQYSNAIFITKEKVDIKESNIITIQATTEGQAATCLLAKSKINNDAPLLITSCDNGMLYNIEALLTLQEEADVIIFTFKGAAAVVANPQQYGWVVVDAMYNALAVHCKKPISATPIKDNAVTGAFWFKQGNHFVAAAEKMILENRRINNEFYVDECMNDCITAGLIVKVFVIDKYICWGTPNDVKTYQYWHSYYTLTNQ